MRLAAILILALGSAAFAQNPPATPALIQPIQVEVAPKAPYDATGARLYVETEKNLQLQATIIQKDATAQMQPLQTQYAEQEKKLAEWMAEVKKANGWGDDYSYDREHNVWKQTVKSAEKK